MVQLRFTNIVLLVLFALFMSTSTFAQGKTKNKEKTPSDGSSQNGTAETKETTENSELKALRKKVERLRLQNELYNQKLTRELHSLKAKQKRQEAKFNLLEQNQKEKLSDLTQKKKKLEAQLELKKKQNEKDLSNLTTKINRLKKELELAETRAKKSLQELKKQKEKLSTKLDLKKAKKNDELSKLKLKLQEKKVELALEEVEAKYKKSKLTNEKLDRKLKLADVHSRRSQMKADIELRKTRSDWKKKVNQEIKYIQKPLQDHVLYLTDRRIKLNGPIVAETGKWVSKRINYFNNQSEKYPIFIVINDSPGGSVMAGMHILKTMKSTEAPVYVVVKERAASMAAAITTLADRSFAFPDAVLLHHEIQSFMGGSLTETEESLEMMKKWWKRLATPIAKKMDLTLEEFRKRLYKENSNGNWQEFASKAKELNWVDHIVERIEDAGVREEPDEEPPSPSLMFFKKRKGKSAIRKDDQGNLYRKLPPLRPFDFYYMYNPNNYYRW